MITIFTPTYNRCKTLYRLYNSLKNQTVKDFCWLIIDDGSTDETEVTVKKWVDERIVNIQYYKQENEGKPSAHNKGVELTTTELFTCVDSDDYLVEDAIEKITNKWKTISKKHIGILAFKGYQDKSAITKNPKEQKEGTLRHLYENGLSGDTMLIFKTSEIKKYRFPIFENEKFIPEAYLYDLLDTQGELSVLNDILYICEYLPDGYTANMGKLLYDNPKGYFCFINQRLKFDKKIKQRFLDSIRYTSMAIAHRKKQIIKKSVYPHYALIAYPFGYVFYFIRYRKFR